MYVWSGPPSVWRQFPLTLNQRVSGSSPERPTTTEAMGESDLERFSVFFGLRFERQQWFHSGYDSTDRRIAWARIV
jgi:hypothetical protein